jgi:hypothetical protein
MLILCPPKDLYQSFVHQLTTCGEHAPEAPGIQVPRLLPPVSAYMLAHLVQSGVSKYSAREVRLLEEFHLLGREL